MKKILLSFLIAFLFQGCAITITRTEINLRESTDSKIEVLQEQKSDTAQSQTANLSAVRGI